MTKPHRIPAALSLDGLPGDARGSFDIAATAGYAGIAIPTNHRELSPDALGDTARRHLKNTLASRGLSVASIRAAAPRGGLASAATIDRTVDNTRRALHLAAELGVHTVSLYVGSLSDSQSADSAMLGALKELAHQADAAGITLALGADALDKLSPLIAGVGYEGVKANLLPALEIAAGDDPLKYLHALVGRVGQLTAADAIKAGRNTRVAEFGEGQVPWTELLEILREQDFRGPTVVDVRDLVDPAQAATHAAKALAKLLGC